MHRNARLTHWGRQELVRRVEAGTPVAHVAAQMNVSRDTAHKWWRRYLDDPQGEWWLDRSSRPRRSPTKTRRKVERKILSPRRNKKLGPARIAGRLQLPASTVHAVLARNGVSRLAWMDPPTGRIVRRYERQKPGELVHVDIKKLGKIPPGGRWRVHGGATLTDAELVAFGSVMRIRLVRCSWTGSGWTRRAPSVSSRPAGRQVMFIMMRMPAA